MKEETKIDNLKQKIYLLKSQNNLHEKRFQLILDILEGRITEKKQINKLNEKIENMVRVQDRDELIEEKLTEKETLILKIIDDFPEAKNQGVFIEGAINREKLKQKIKGK